jgi:hypothetical protein
MFELGPLPIALIASLLGTALLTWHRHGGSSWLFGFGGFLFILGRLMIAAICGYLLLSFRSMFDEVDGERLPIIGLVAAGLVAIGGWSAFVVARAVYRDAFGPVEEEAARARRA